jgi:hypothetical protein
MGSNWDAKFQADVKAWPAHEAAKTVSLWIRIPSNTPTWGSVLVLGDGGGVSLQIGVRANKVVSAWNQAFRDDFSVNSDPAPPGWHHVVYTFDGTSHRLIVDGAIRTAPSGPAAPRGPIARVAIGNYPGVVVDDVRVYSRVVTPGEIARLREGAP